MAWPGQNAKYLARVDQLHQFYAVIRIACNDDNHARCTTFQAIDDVLGLIILAVVVGIVATGTVDLFSIGYIVLVSSFFLGTAVLFGDRFVRLTLPLVRVLDRHHCKVLFPLSLCFLFAWLANQVELATIVGAFVAGLILNESHFIKDSHQKMTIEEMIRPLETIFAPIFFVFMGMQVNLASFLNPEALGLAGAFIVVALLSKLVAGLPAGPGIDRLSVGIGMIPRGEVGLIFASVGKGLGVISDSLFFRNCPNGDCDHIKLACPELVEGPIWYTP